METEQTPFQSSSPQQSGDPVRSAFTWGMLCHLTALLGFLGFPLHSILPLPLWHVVGPLVVWLLKRNEHPFIEEQGKESLNFQISMTIYALVAAILMLVVIGFFALMILAILDIVLVIIASVKASNGESYKYPLTIRFLR